jgi:hypothetical protein
MTSRRETIHISLGSTANAVSAHLLNLEGLAATSSLFQADVTHAVHQELYVPRCLFVEEGEALSFHEDEEEPPAVENPYLQAANVLAYAPYSRYRAPKTTTNVYSASSNGRHVDWGDEEEEEEEEEDEAERHKRQKRERDQWQAGTLEPLQQQLEEHWATAAKEEPSEEETTKPLDWKTFLAPPHPPNFHCTLPFSSQSKMVDTWDAYNTASKLGHNNWMENVLFENLRKILEKSEGVQGITIATEGHGIYAGLTTALLQELQEECRTAGRIVLHVSDPPTIGQEDVEDTWQPAHVLRTRKHIASGLALFDFGQTAHCIVPLSVKSENTMFERTSQIAMAWETATLAYRAESARMASGYGDVPCRLSVREFLSSLQPSARYNLLELDYLSENYSDLSLQPGTSVERRLQQQNRESQSQQATPGGWMDTSLKSLSPNDGSRRSLHHHWSLTTSLRSTTKSNDDLTCIMEGMGIRYRPELSLGVLMDQSLKELTSGGYAAGAYWKASPKQAVVSVLSNSTRSYDFAKTVANNMKENLTSFRFKGYHNRDVTNNILPEKEDCLEAMEYCLGLRDTYHPPEGSGLGDDAEGTYFNE